VRIECVSISIALPLQPDKWIKLRATVTRGAGAFIVHFHRVDPFSCLHHGTLPLLPLFRKLLPLESINEWLLISDMSSEGPVPPPA